MTTSTETMAEQALSVAHSLRDPAVLTATLTPQAATTLCDGLPGTALLHACLSRSDPAFETAANNHWATAARLLGTAPADGIYTGPGALAASLIIGTGYLTDPDRHLAAVHNATTWLSARAEGLARHQQQRTERGQPGAPWAVYDVIKGLSGIGRVLLAAHTAGHHHAEPGLTAALTTLTTLIHSTHGPRPGWWLPAADHPPPVTVHPSGAATTGLAHGIAGPLALLSIAHTAGFTVPDQPDAIRAATTWLLTWQEPTGTWPPFISGQALTAYPAPQAIHSPPGRRDAWCYGTPGIARALTLAGDSLTDPSMSPTGRAAITTLAHRTSAQWDTEGPTLCHGSTGILQAAARAHCPTTAHQAAEHTTASHDHHHPFGFPHTEGGTKLNTPGFLTGATGTALTLADHTGLLPPDPPTSWDCLLLLS